MANNRMYLRCKSCGRSMFLGKTFGDGYYTSNIYYDGKEHEIDDSHGDPDAFLRAFNDFIDKHFFCTETPIEDSYLEPKFSPKECHPENNFEIAYELVHEEEDET